MRRKNRIRRRSMRREKRGARVRLFIGFLILVLCTAATPVSVRTRITQAGKRAIKAFDQWRNEKKGSVQLSLDEMTIYAMQLGVFDSGERVAQEAQRLAAQGVPCVIWQGEQMRLICAVAFAQEKLYLPGAEELETCIYRETLPEIHFRLTAGENEIQEIRALFMLPDDTLRSLVSNAEIDLDTICAQVRRRAEGKKEEHPEQPVFTQLAQSLLDWCSLCEESGNRQYAAAAMCTLCRELRRSLAQL